MVMTSRPARLERCLQHVRAVHPAPLQVQETTPQFGVRLMNAKALVAAGLCEWAEKDKSIRLKETT